RHLRGLGVIRQVDVTAPLHHRGTEAGRGVGSVQALERQNLLQILAEHHHLDVQSTPRIVQKILRKRTVIGRRGDLEYSDVLPNIPEFLVCMETGLPTNYA